MAIEIKHVEIYTDGACSGNPGPGGYGAVIIYKNQRREISQGFKITTNNRMEILAVIEALKILNQPCNINLYSDSKYLIDAITKGWLDKWQKNNWHRNKKDLVLNIDLWKELLNLLELHNINLREPIVKYFEDGIFELRTQVGNNITKIFYFFYVGKKIILTNGFVKKTQKTPRKQIDLAIEYKKDYLSRGEKN